MNKKYGEFTLENAHKYYSNLVKKYNKEYLEIEFRYGHAICDKNLLKESASVLPGRLYSQIISTKTPGYFFNDMTKININGYWRYYSELTKKELIEQDKDVKKSINNLLNKL